MRGTSATARPLGRPNVAQNDSPANDQNLTAQGARKERAKSAQIIPLRRARDIDTCEYTQEFNTALRNDVAGFRHATKIVAQAGNANIRTADNWIKGQCVPNSLQLFRIASTQGFEHVRAFALRMMAAESELDAPRVQRLLRELHTVVGDMEMN